MRDTGKNMIIYDQSNYTAFSELLRVISTFLMVASTKARSWIWLTRTFIWSFIDVDMNDDTDIAEEFETDIVQGTVKLT